VRRIVTGHDANGRAKVLIDDTAPNVRAARDGKTATLIWCTDAMPANMPVGENVEDMGARSLGTAPPACGTRFAINTTEPGRSGAFHRTETLDYVIVIEGEIEMELDDTSVHLVAGDVLIQRGTVHRWTNTGTVTAVVAFILIDAVPLGIGTGTTLRGT
jgi:mannose-6-phosphate isomerase-like protein (cupin superfamily)